MQPNAEISVEGDMEYVSRNRDKPVLWKPGASGECGVLLRMLGQCITDITVEDGEALAVSLSNGDKLILYDSSSEYESFLVAFDNRTIVV